MTEREVFFMKRWIAVFCLCAMILTVFCACAEKPSEKPAGDFSFTLVWGCYGISSYDSKTGKLVKTNHATHPEDYVTTFYFTEAELAEIEALLSALDLKNYPDEYDPHLTEDGQTTLSSPSMDLILTVEMNGEVKTVACRDIALQYTSRVKKGNALLQTCKQMIDQLTATEEWRALPDYEFLYD
jgi:hypothetical protein